jgi:hypothetical protein
MKSSFYVIVNERTYGSQTIAFGFPLNYENFASISPNVLVTDNLPGNTRCGPMMNGCYSP